MPKYLRRKLCAEFKPKTRIFEIQPTSGVLDPGERSNMQVKFMPKEEVSFKEMQSHSDSLDLFELYSKSMFDWVSRETLSDLSLTILIMTFSALIHAGAVSWWLGAPALESADLSNTLTFTNRPGLVAFCL